MFGIGSEKVYWRDSTGRIICPEKACGENGEMPEALAAMYLWGMAYGMQRLGIY